MWREKLSTLLLANKIATAFACLGLLLILIGIASLIFSEREEPGVIIEEAASIEKSSESSGLLVDVSGAVIKPGVYKLSKEARLQDALMAAGGLSEKADRAYVSKNMNLAIKVSDGAKIYVPVLGESSPNTQNTAGFVAGTSSGLININTASMTQLDTLIGIGPKTAEKIINARPYNTIDELVNKKVVGSKVFDDIKEKITVF